MGGQALCLYQLKGGKRPGKSLTKLSLFGSVSVTAEGRDGMLGVHVGLLCVLSMTVYRNYTKIGHLQKWFKF